MRLSHFISPDVRNHRPCSTMMFSFRNFLLAGAAAALFLASAPAHAADEYPQLGTHSLESLSYSFDATVDENCEYALTVQFKHNPDFPIGTEDTCKPGEIADYDGRAYLEGRWMYEEFPEYIFEATDLNHLSLDYNPCGHPTGGFLISHYDLHFYMVTPQYRAEDMLCETIPGTPVCFPDQTTDSGKAFFEIERILDGNETLQVNMPPGFTDNSADAVIFMGMHSFNRDMAPESPSDWMEPSFIIVSHAGKPICVEPMLPFQFTVGDEDHYYMSDPIEYVEQSIPTLANMFEANFDAASGVTTVTLYGTSNVCKEDFDAKKADYEASVAQPPAAEDGAVTITSLLATAMAGLLAVAVM